VTRRRLGINFILISFYLRSETETIDCLIINCQILRFNDSAVGGDIYNSSTLPTLASICLSDVINVFTDNNCGDKDVLCMAAYDMRFN
jgi:hypothetical protein